MERVIPEVAHSGKFPCSVNDVGYEDEKVISRDTARSSFVGTLRKTSPELVPPLVSASPYSLEEPK